MTLDSVTTQKTSTCIKETDCAVYNTGIRKTFQWRDRTTTQAPRRLLKNLSNILRQVSKQNAPFSQIMWDQVTFPVSEDKTCNVMHSTISNKVGLNSSSSSIICYFFFAIYSTRITRPKLNMALLSPEITEIKIYTHKQKWHANAIHIFFIIQNHKFCSLRTAEATDKPQL
jgi:hypothetical protein